MQLKKLSLFKFIVMLVREIIEISIQWIRLQGIDKSKTKHLHNITALKYPLSILGLMIKSSGVNFLRLLIIK